MSNADIVEIVRVNVAEMVEHGDAERPEPDDGTFRLTELGVMRQQVALLTAYVQRIHALVDGATTTLTDFKNPWVTFAEVARTLDGWVDDTPPRPDVAPVAAPTPPVPAPTKRVFDAHPGQYL